MPLTTDGSIPTAADLRALRARRQVELYVLAARARIHPSRLGQYLNGSIEMTPEIASRIALALESEAAGAA
jgi:hypothetical protein